MNIHALILKELTKKGEVRVADIVKATGFSRAYLNRFFQDLREKGKIVLLGKANQARYVLTGKGRIKEIKSKVLTFHQILQNRNLSEDRVLDEIKEKTGIFLHLSKNLAQILNYAFTEMLNNAIEHSKSNRIEVFMKRAAPGIQFEVIDRGIGIFNNLMKKRKLKNELEAIQDLLKGKQTTAPKEHTGEGIFFTSKAGDTLTIQSSTKKLIFDNTLNDIFIRDIQNRVGTKVTFTIRTRSARNLNSIFKEYAEESFEFRKTRVIVKLYKLDTEYVSRSQARRILSGIEKFKSILLDFKNVNMVGQAFADEIFRVWKAHHPEIKISYQNANENIIFMIKRALAQPHELI